MSQIFLLASHRAGVAQKERCIVLELALRDADGTTSKPVSFLMQREQAENLVASLQTALQRLAQAM